MIADFFREECSGWHPRDLVWLLSSSAAVTVLAILAGDRPLGIVAALFGIAAAVCTGKGKRLAFVFGGINALMYAWIAFHAGYFGETAFSLLVKLPLEFVGIALWSRHIDRSTHEVAKRRMGRKGRLIVLAAILLGTAGLVIVLTAVDGTLPGLDAATTAASVAAILLAVGRYAETWWLWIAINAATIVMWTADCLQGSGNIATLLMWVVYLVNSVMMCVRWQRDSAA